MQALGSSPREGAAGGHLQGGESLWVGLLDVLDAL